MTKLSKASISTAIALIVMLTSMLFQVTSTWDLSPLSERSLDNLPNPHQTGANPYVPTNGPAIGDLMNLFNFNHLRSDTPSLPFVA